MRLHLARAISKCWKAGMQAGIQTCVGPEGAVGSQTMELGSSKAVCVCHWGSIDVSAAASKCMGQCRE